MPENDKYNKLIGILKRSVPVAGNQTEIENEVMHRIEHGRNSLLPARDFIESLFSWVYIGWVRKSLVTASVVLVLFFVYQQTMILRGVNEISKREIRSADGTKLPSADRIERQLMMLRLTGRGLTPDNSAISKELLELLVESYNELQDKYSNLIRIIESDPELKKYFEQKLNENNSKKANL